MKLFQTREVIKHKIVEIPAGSKLPELTTDLRESLKTLQHSPAFNYIIHRLRYQRAAMEEALRNGMNLDEQKLRYLQSGIYWASQIETDISTLTQVPSATPRVADNHEALEFAKVKQSLDLIGA